MPIDSFEFYNPTHIFLEENGLDQIGSIISKYKKYRVLIVYGGNSLVRSGNLERIVLALKSNNIIFESLGGVGANPDISFVRLALEKARIFNPDLLLAVGGGSVIDAVKSMANSFYYEGDPLDFNRHLLIPTKVLPFATVLTLAASGSEMSSSCVISDRASGFKGGFNSPTNYPLFSLLDPTLTYTVPPFQTACGLVDIISHSFERYFCSSRRYELADYLALSVIKEVIELSPCVLKNPTDYEARRAMILCGTVSHNGWTSFGKNYAMKCHFVEHKISGVHPEIAHGLGLRWLLVPFLRINSSVLTEKITKFGSFIFNTADVDQTISCLENYLQSLPLKQLPKDFGISEAEEKEYLNLLRLEQ